MPAVLEAFYYYRLCNFICFNATVLRLIIKSDYATGVVPFVCSSYELECQNAVGSSML